MLPAAWDIHGYVLAGGKSSRMGQDKTLLELNGKPLLLLAVEKLRRVCAEVYVLGNRPELERYAPLVRDLHEGCGPLGGIEAALLHSADDWNLFMAVDMPFLPTGFLSAWVGRVIAKKTARVALFTEDGMPQPALCLLQREVAPFVRAAVARGSFKIFPVLMDAVQELAARQGVGLNEVFLNSEWGATSSNYGGGEWTPTQAQRAGQHLWFANLNTPEEFRAAQAFAGLLETD